ncbi:MAG: barstar family protein [Bacteroidota bacterium]|jgi:RNAse (barnase) inhibitor barstar
MANYTILQAVTEKHNSEKTLVAIIDGTEVDTLEKFYIEVSSQLKFPDNFGNNFDAFDEMINDLDWLTETNIYLVFKNYDDFLSEENDEAREILLTILDDAASEWKRVDDSESKKLRMQIEPSELGEDDLETLGIEYKQD